MADSEVRTPAAANVVEGFSQRFNVLMDLAGVPSQNRVTVGARRFRVVHNTFKAWCMADRIPGTHAALLELVEELLKDVPGRHNPKAVVAWLLAGDAVPNPFGDDTDALALVELYLQISKVAQQKGIDLNGLPRETRNLILKHVSKHLAGNLRRTGTEEGLHLDDAARSMVIAMLETAHSMT